MCQAQNVLASLTQRRNANLEHIQSIVQIQSKLALRDRLVQAEAMTIDNYRAMLKERQIRRDIYAGLAGEFDACVTLTATGAAPVGLGIGRIYSF